MVSNGRPVHDLCKGAIRDCSRPLHSAYSFELGIQRNVGNPSPFQLHEAET